MEEQQACADAQARQWLARLHGGAATAQDRTRFEAWLSAGVDHPRAYRRAEQIWRDLSLIDTLGDINIERPNVFQRLRSRSVFAAAACILVVAVGLVAVLRSLEERIATQVAEIRELTLPDGSRVALGARSAIAIDFNSASRNVTLKSGEAFFSVVKDASRPFYVSAGDTRVRVLGTQFDVHHGAQEIRVAVTEGVVEVFGHEESAAAKRVLTAGQELIARRAAPSEAPFVVRNVDLSQPGAWRRGRLNYENASLAEIVADANRYSAREIVFDTKELRDLRVTTAFRTDQIDEMLTGLAATHAIVIDRDRSDRIVLRARR